MTVNGCTGPITTFVIEPFVPHKEEFYLSITSTRNGWEVAFSEAGGIHIEEVRAGWVAVNHKGARKRAVLQ